MTEQISNKLKAEAELNASTLMSSIMQGIMEWLPLIQDLQEGKLSEKEFKVIVVKNLLGKKSEIAQRMVAMGTSAENQLTDLSELSTLEMQKIADQELCELQDKYIQIIGNIYSTMRKIAEQYQTLEEQYIKPIIEKYKIGGTK